MTSRATFQDRMVTAQARWVAWCAAHEVDPQAATVRHVQDAVLDHQLAGLDVDDVVDLLDAAAIATGTGRDTRLLDLRIAL
ncbi:hypothetical protein GXB85_13555 [Cellulomonas sp. APG4]|uniref:hypothetical protein n=1 Tax=Cellulomonas sp. APG4 TaxID=1538656 RepID=UPI00137B8910|nr:hypothetical protein [Cellulomonas sp. APG4]NCT91968.1 hypothetical protein [Cellulomonas sp. APG4]